MTSVAELGRGRGRGEPRCVQVVGGAASSAIVALGVGRERCGTDLLNQVSFWAVLGRSGTKPVLPGEILLTSPRIIVLVETSQTE